MNEHKTRQLRFQKGSQRGPQPQEMQAINWHAARSLGFAQSVSYLQLVSSYPTSLMHTLRFCNFNCKHMHRPFLDSVRIAAMAPERRLMYALGIACFLLAHAAADGNGVKFGYSGADRPANWGSLSPEFWMCSSGRHQSPIDIVKHDLVYNPELEPLRRYYVAANATLVDNGFNIAVRYGQGVGKAYVEGKNYTLTQMHWHSPSEHTINGERFPMELHLVHKSDDGNITVVAVLYKYGRPDPFLLQIQEQMAELAREVSAGDQDANVPTGTVNTKAMQQHARKYFRYVGSLTTPPCTENVIWSILGKVKEMTKEQAAALRAPLQEEYRHNSRPTQPLNGRKVQLYDESKRSAH